MTDLKARRTGVAGFTLMELLIVVAIIAILTAIALPIYSSYVTRSRITEATNNLSAYRVTMEQFYQDNRDYGPAPSGAACGIDPTTINNTLHYFTITCVPGAASSTAAGPQSYVATATGNEGGTMAGFSYTIDNNNNKTSTVPTNWGGTQNCWITSQGTCQ